MTVRGTVRGDTVVLDRGACLPDGAEVEVRLLSEPQISREEAFARVWAVRAALAGRQIGMSEIIEEEKQEREEHPDRWLSPGK